MIEFLQELNNLVPEITNYINQFNSIISENNLNVITDVQGNLMVDAPSNLSDQACDYFGKKVGVIDRIINSKLDEADKLIEQGNAMQKEIKNSNHSSQIQAKLKELNQLKNKYGHFIAREN